MRCKNCGTENDDNRYICENCGSPLYDEENISINNDNEKTQTFKAFNQNENYGQDGSSDSEIGYGNDNRSDRKTNNSGANKETDKKGLIIIAVLVIVLIAIIASIIAIANGRKDSDNELESSVSELTKISDVSSTENTTEKEITTEKETEKTTEKTTAEILWIINTSSSGGGETNGDGKYKNGDKVTLTATADDGYEFDGWYSNGIKVSNKANYSFTANENASFSAVFNPVETTTPTTEAPIEPTDATVTPNVVFGE